VRQKKVSRFILEAMDSPGTPLTAPVKSSPMEVIRRNAPAEKVSGSKGSSSITPAAGGLLKLNSYQIDDYKTCPLKYKYIHILNVPVLPHHSIIYGKAIHDAISTFFNKKMEGEDLSIERLITTFEASWKGEGFVTREHELKRLEAGKEALRRFYHSQEEAGITPSAVEKSFVFETGDNIIKGRWDLIEERADGPYIIDFKTSEIKEQKKADDRARKSIQLNLYVIAYRECFNKMPAGAELHFLESGLVGNASPGEKEIAKTLEIVEKVASGIRAADYTARPDYLNCSYCPFTSICTEK
ncbi:MAG: RecB family exonuclease, partial [Thermodesulfobacteriota bacterium]